MKAFFKNHGNSLLYIVLPIFFLLITVSLIEFTPSKGISTPFDPCANTDECCNASGCGEMIGEICEDGLCERFNVFCADGEEPIQTPDTCTCPDGSECIQCQPDEVFLDNACRRVCVDQEDADTSDCVLLQGTGEAFPCSLQKSGNASPKAALVLLAGLALLWAFRGYSQKNNA